MRGRVVGVGVAVAAAIAAAAAALVALPGAAAADASFVVNPGAAPPPLTDAEREDAQRFAEQEGRDVGAVVSAAAGQNQFAVLATEVEGRFPQVFSSARWDPDDLSRGEIAFVGLPPTDAVDLIRDSGQAVRVVVVGGAAGQEAVAAQVRAYGAVHDVPGVVAASAAVEPAAATVTVTVEVEPGEDVAQVVADARRAAERAVGPAPVEVEVVAGRVQGGED